MIAILRFVLLTCTLLTCVPSVFAQPDKRVDAIRQYYLQANRQAAESEGNGTQATTFLSELVINKNNGSYPAIGNYRVVIKFYYTFGEREKSPYPDRLLKITTTTRRSAQTEFAEYLFDPVGQLIFYFEKTPEAERRIYFASEQPIRILHGEKPAATNSTVEAAAVKSVLKEKQRLVSIFRQSLE